MSSAEHLPPEAAPRRTHAFGRPLPAAAPRLLEQCRPMPSSYSMPETVPFVAPTTWVKAAIRCRFNIEPLFRAAGVTATMEGGLMPRVRPQALNELMRACVEAARPDFHFPLVAGEMFAFDHLPALETFLTTSTTPRQALAGLGWVSLALPLMSMRLEEEGDMAALVVEYGDPHAPPEENAYSIEMALAGIHKFSRLVLGEIPPGCSAQMRHDPGKEMRELFEASSGVAVLANQPRNAVRFPRQLLDVTLHGAMPALNQQAQAIVQRTLPPVPEAGVIEQIEHGLMRDAALLAVSMEEMAARLKLHPRTLQRRLNEAGLSWSDLRARCRQRLAEEGLREGGDIEALSERLGFSDRHSFTRAFKRWTGLTPSEWRRRERG